MVPTELPYLVVTLLKCGFESRAASNITTYLIDSRSITAEFIGLKSVFDVCSIAIIGYLMHFVEDSIRKWSNLH